MPGKKRDRNPGINTVLLNTGISKSAVIDAIEGTSFQAIIISSGEMRNYRGNQAAYGCPLMKVKRSFMNFVSYLLEKSHNPDKLLILGDDTALTYKDFIKNLEKLSSGLNHRHGSRKKFLVMADNSIFFIISYLAIIHSGNTAVVVETRINASDLKKIMDSCSLSGIFTQDKYSENFEGSEIPLFDENFLGNLQNENTKNFVNILPVASDDDVAVIIFTSGSTGTKKGVMLTHKNLIANTGSIIDYLKLNEADRICVTLPFFYCYGASLLHTHIRVGGSIVLSQKPFLGAVIKDIDKYQCTGFAGVPSTYLILVNKTPFLHQKYPSLRYFTQAGGKLPDEYIKKITDKFPEKHFFVMYGATEATARLSYLPHELVITKMGSIGKGIPGVTLKVLNELGFPVKESEIGEIVAKGDNIMKGYLNDPEGTRGTLRDGWLYTGDLATVDDDGFIFIVGRSKNIIKSGGYRISPHEIEDVILSLEKVKECIVLGIPDEVMGEAVVAVIPKSGDVDSTTLQREILTHCTRNLPSYKVPKKIVFIDELPLNPSNKTDFARIKEIVLGMENRVTPEKKSEKNIF
jgi:long-chain acyl-CoA synthetase